MKNKHHYFEKKLSHGFISLYTSKSIIRIAGGLFGVFLPVFLYEFFEKNIQFVAWWYIAGSVLFVLLIGLGAKFMNIIGFRRALRAGSIFGAMFFASLFFADSINVWAFSSISIMILTIHRMFHWIPYHVDFAKFTNKKDRGKELGLLEATTNVIGVFAPFVAGFILGRFGFNTLFVVAVVIFILSVLPLLTIPKTHEKFTWGYFETWKEFFSKEKRKLTIAHVADGAEQSIGLVIWPIFIFDLLNGDYLQVGTLAAVITGVTIILQLFVGKYTDNKIIRSKLLKFGSLFYAIGWIFKIFVATAFHIFIADSYHRFMKIFMRLPFDALTYDLTADNGHFVDELTVLNEMALHFGKALMLLAVIALSMFLSLNMTFILAAVASILLNFIRTQGLLRRKKRNFSYIIF